MMIVKKHITPDKRLMLAVCDSDILGKVFNEGGRMIDLTSDFYDGEEMAPDKVLELMGKAYMMNLVGKLSVGTAVGAGKVDKKNIIEISGVPCAQVLVVPHE